ncbi:MAG TPA: ankyrin repeat domain-containing protein [Gemmatimonas sp.]|nr:ankyrin repeat domain-containing protein [Gemmatimonas sp.]
MSKTKDERTLDGILQDIARILFPADEPSPRVTLTSTDCDGDTPLHVYLRRRDPHAVRVLLAHGATVNAVGDMGETPLHVAMRDAPSEIIAAILAAGAREDIVSEFGQTPLQLAQMLQRESVYKEAKNLARNLKRT